MSANELGPQGIPGHQDGFGEIARLGGNVRGGHGKNLLLMWMQKGSGQLPGSPVEVVLGGQVTAVLADLEVAVVAAGASGGAHIADQLALADGLSWR